MEIKALLAVVPLDLPMQNVQVKPTFKFLSVRKERLTAREQIEQVVREANEERCKRNKAREKRRLEASNNNGKRNKPKP